ncbi:MAG TPA: response regulator [Pirellulaceae bacterium]|nr:response regulator [Pirellulaceae bacterium]
MNALVIDDSRAVRMLIGRILREQGFQVCEAGHGQDGLQKLRENPDIGLVLVDWNMPVMDGLEFIQAVRRDRTWDGVRLVMVTTETESEQVQRAISAGANEYVMKPFTPEVLVAKLTMLGAFEDN